MRTTLVGTLLGILLCAMPLAAQKNNLAVELEDVIDNRVAAGEWRGTLEFRFKLTGGGATLDKATAARIVIKEANDDRGTKLTGDEPRLPDFTARDVNMGMLQASVSSPARAASTVKLKGTIELFAPSRDPNAVVTIQKALSKLDAPLSAKALTAAKVSITPLSPTAYAAARKARKIDDAKIAEIRAEGKKRGVSEAEIDAAIEMAKALDSMDEEPPANAVILQGKKADFDRIYRIDILGADGKPMDTPSRSTSSRGDNDSLMIINPSGELPANAALQVFLLTDKSRVTTPFELTVNLP
jgi:hypothetical protein